MNRPFHLLCASALLPLMWCACGAEGTREVGGSGRSTPPRSAAPQREAVEIAEDGQSGDDAEGDRGWPDEDARRSLTAHDHRRRATSPARQAAHAALAMQQRLQALQALRAMQAVQAMAAMRTMQAFSGNAAMGGGDNYWAGRFGAGNCNADNTQGYVYIPGTGSVSYGF